MKEWRWVDDLFQDLRYTIRSLARHTVFSLTALIILALGIGANTAMFSVVDSVILRPLPFEGEDRLVQLFGTPAERGEAIQSSDLEEFRTAGSSFEVIAGYGVAARYMQGTDTLERVMTVEAERGFFSMLGTQPLIGRTFQSGDPSDTAVASASFWRRRLGGESALGKTVTVDGTPRTIVGVMPDSFQFPYSAASRLQNAASEARTDLWILREPAPGQPPRGRLLATGRLKPNVALAAATSELNVIMKRLELQFPHRLKGLGIRLVPLSDAVVSPPVRRSLFILFGAAGLVLLLACANVANLLLVQASMRGKEIAARSAVGASPSRLFRQFLTESLLVSFAGGFGGLALAWWGTDRLMQLAAPHIPRAIDIGMSWSVFLFSFGACLVTGILFGIAPALSAMRTDPHSVLNEASRSTMSVRQRRLRDGLVAVEVALAFVLAVGATLLVRELVRLRNTEMGMIPDNVITVHIGQQMTQGMDGRQFYDIAQRVRNIPGVREAGFTQMLPLQSWGWTGNSTDFRVRGRAPSDQRLFSMELRYVTPGYFQTLGIPIIKGRGFTDQDVKDAPPVIVINEALAKTQFGSEDPIGQQTSRGTIVGIIADVRQQHLDRPAMPEVYYAIAQNWSQIGELGMSLVVNTDGPPLAMTDTIRAKIRDVNPRAAIFSIKTMDRVVRDSLSDFILYLTLMSAFAGLALFLACSGTYGVISFLAESRNREFAIRSALGAARSQVTRLVLRDALRLTVLGIVAGLLIVTLSRPLLLNLPVNVKGPDAITVISVTIAITLLTLMACVVPARRAAASDPMSALRKE